MLAGNKKVVEMLLNVRTKLAVDYQIQSLDPLIQLVERLNTPVSGERMNFAPREDSPSKYTLERRLNARRRVAAQQREDHLIADGKEHLRKFNVNFPDRLGRTPLHEAAEKNNLGAVELLLAHGANAKLQDKNGHTPLLKAHKA